MLISIRQLHMFHASTRTINLIIFQGILLA